MRIKFGKYTGTEVRDLPSGYIEQLLHYIPIRDKKLKRCLESELRSRVNPNYGIFADEYYEYVGGEWTER